MPHVRRTATCAAVVLALALMTSGCRFFSWGGNLQWQLGDGSASGRSTPGEVPTPDPWQLVDGGSEFNCGIRGGGDAVVLGRQQLRRNSATAALRPRAPAGAGRARFGDWQRVSAGGQHACGIRAGQLFCWGDNFNGQLGDGTGVQRLVPTRVGTATDWSEVTCGSAALVRHPRRRAVVLGRQPARSARQRHDDGRVQSRARRRRERLDPVTAGGAHTCGIRAGGQLWCWGGNESGQLGDNSTSDRLVPTRIGTATTGSRST